VTIKTQGTDLYVLAPADGTGDPIIQRITCVTDLTGIGAGTADQIDVTCLSELTDRQFEGGLNSPGTVSGSVNYSDDDASLDTLQYLADSKQKVRWFVGLSNGSLPGVDPDDRPRPTLTGGSVTFPTTRTFFEFLGYVAEFGMDIPGNSVVKNPLTIQRSGAKIRHKATAPLVPETVSA
jgi:hypothetical protein